MKFVSRAQTSLSQDVAHMKLHRSCSETENRCDLLIREPARKKPCHFEFATSQRQALRGSAEAAVDDVPSVYHLRREIELSLGQHCHGSRQLLFVTLI